MFKQKLEFGKRQSFIWNIMDPMPFFYSTSSESEDECNITLIRRNIRDKSNPLSLPEVE